MNSLALAFGYLMLRSASATYYDTQTSIAAELLVGYDKTMHPGQSVGNATAVATEAFVAWVDGISLKHNSLNVLLDMQHTWQDSRLAWSGLNYSSAISKVKFSNTKLNGWQVWKPSFVFPKCKQHVLHESYKVSSAGEVTFIQSLDLSCRCSYKFGQFPWASQMCYLDFSPYQSGTSAMTNTFSQAARLNPTLSSAEFTNFEIGCYTDRYKGKYWQDAEVSRSVISLSFDRDASGEVASNIIPAMLSAVLGFLNTYLKPSTAVKVASTVMVGCSIMLSKSMGQYGSKANGSWFYTFLIGNYFFNMANVAITLGFALVKKDSDPKQQGHEAGAGKLDSFARTCFEPYTKLNNFARRHFEQCKHVHHMLKISYAASLVVFWIVLLADWPSYAEDFTLPDPAGYNRVDCL